MAAFHNDNMTISYRAHKFILQNYLMNEELLEKMEEVIIDGASDLIIYRVCSIIEKYSKRYPSLVVENFPFINKLLRNCDKRSVLDLFRKLSIDTAFDKEMTRFLQAINTPKIILSLINNSDNPEIEDSLNIEKNPFEIAGLFNLISILSDNELLRTRFQTENALSIISKIFSEPISQILDQQWKTIIILFDDSTISTLKDIIPVAVDNINYRVDKYSEFQTLSIDFLTCFIESDNSYIEEFVDNNIFSYLYDAMRDFPYHTILHQSVTKFITTCLKTEFSNTVIDIVVPFASDYFINSECEVLRASCLNLLYEMNKQPYGNNAISNKITKEHELWNYFLLIDQSKKPPISPSSSYSKNTLLEDNIIPLPNSGLL